MPTALVTGTSSGIGFATALRLVGDGYDVVAGMRDPARDGPRLEQAAALVVPAAGARPGRLRSVALDVDDDDSVAAAFAAAGPLDVLVNNAGTSPVGSVEEFAVPAWKALFETNVFGVVRCIQAALPGFRRQGHGCIVNISSVAGRAVIPMFGPYGASKWAVEALSEALAMEVRPFGVRVVVIEPGAIRTPIQQKTTPPPRDSPYREAAKNWGFAMGYDHARASDPELVADAVADAVADGGVPLRRPVGQGCAALVDLRDRLGEEDWVALWSLPTPRFLERYREVSGLDVSPSGGG